MPRWIVARSHGEQAAVDAEAHFTRVVREGQQPEEIASHPLADDDPIHLPALIAGIFGGSTSEARRLIADGAVRIDSEVVTELDIPRERLVGAVLQAGKRRFARLTED